MVGVIQNSRYARKRKVAVNPIEHAYHGPDEKPYIKYNCPVCEAVGNWGVSISYGTPACPLCGVRLNWARQPEIGDQVICRPETVSYGNKVQQLVAVNKEQGTVQTKEGLRGCLLRQLTILEEAEDE